ncbi:hypothetical protein WA556_001147, partial [Blastocystis sp. ATCC 50177/Nand II]
SDFVIVLFGFFVLIFLLWIVFSLVQKMKNSSSIDKELRDYEQLLRERESRKVKIVNRRGTAPREPVPILSKAELEEARINMSTTESESEESYSSDDYSSDE